MKSIPVVAAGVLVMSIPAFARDNVRIAGSSAVLPYASIVAETFGESFDFPIPVVESGGSSAGLRRFCEGVGENTIDIANASRAIREREIQECAANGVIDIIEVRLGYEGLVVASQNDGPAFSDFQLSDLFNALAPMVLIEGEIVENPNSSWSDFNPDLPSVEILAFIPAIRHSMREAFERGVIEAGCKATGTFQAMIDSGLAEEDAEDACLDIRTDGRAVDIDGDFTEMLARIDANPNAIGIFDLAFYESNTDRLKVATVAGVEPNSGTIASEQYPVSRPLFLYVKGEHIGVIPGLEEFVEYFISDEIMAQDGTLAQRGLVTNRPRCCRSEEILTQQCAPCPTKMGR